VGFNTGSQGDISMDFVEVAPQRHGDIGLMKLFAQKWMETTLATRVKPMLAVLKGIPSTQHCIRFGRLHCSTLLGSTTTGGFSLCVATHCSTYSTLLDSMAPGIILCPEPQAKSTVGTTTQKMV